MCERCVGSWTNEQATRSEEDLRTGITLSLGVSPQYSSVSSQLRPHREDRPPRARRSPEHSLLECCFRSDSMSSFCDPVCLFFFLPRDSEGDEIKQRSAAEVLDTATCPKTSIASFFRKDDALLPRLPRLQTHAHTHTERSYLVEKQAIRSRLYLALRCVLVVAHRSALFLKACIPRNATKELRPRSSLRAITSPGRAKKREVRKENYRRRTYCGSVSCVDTMQIGRTVYHSDSER